MPENGEVKLAINGQEVTSAPGRLLIDVAEELDIFVPRFCYHPGLESVAACRMCLVEIEGAKRPLEPACTTYVADGMVVRTNSPTATLAQEGVLELLLINHPLDCPICDRGGECPLQDQALRFGPGSSRYMDSKRHFPKPIPISDLVMLDRERCVLCWRCVRFSEEIAGDPFIDLLDRGSMTQVNTAEGHPFDSHFSGNTIQVCPVGALTAAPYRFLSRPWDLEVAQSVCSFCSVGCPITVEVRGGEVLRAQALPNDSVNSFWNCDKGRFGHHYVSHRERLKAPLVRRNSSEGPRFEETSWQDALWIVVDRLKATIRDHGPHSVAMIGGSHSTNEDLYAAGRFFREVVGTPHLDARTYDQGFEYDRLDTGGIVGSSAVLDDLDRARAILWFGPDPKEELPVLYLRIRRAVSKGARLIVVHPRRISLSSLGIHLRAAPGAEAALIEALWKPQQMPGIEPKVLDSAREALGTKDSSGDATRSGVGSTGVGPVVVCVGQQFAGRPMTSALASLRSLVDSLPDARVLLCVPHANSQGAIDMGVYPGLSAGHRSVPAGMDTRAILAAAAEGSIEFLWIMGADVVSDFPDQALADAALASKAFVVVSELFPTDTARSADVLLPAEAFAEKEGSFTNLERRVQKVSPAVAAPGVARADWWMFADLASRMGRSWGWVSSADVAAEIAASVATHAGYSWEEINPPALPRPRQGTLPAANAWPLSWELRAVDATRRRGWVWPLDVAASGAASGSPTGRPPGMTGSATPREAAPASSPSLALERPSAGPLEASAGSEEFPLVLLASRALFDNGQMVSRSPDLRPVTPEPFVELHHEEAERRGLVDGQQVQVSSERGSIRLKLVISEDTPKGAAFMLFDQPGVRANLLMDSRAPESFVEVSA